jgi:hypothetical protein
VSRLTEGTVPGGAARNRALAALCLTEIVSYGVLFYAFPVLATDITGSTGWSRTAITAAYFLALAGTSVISAALISGTRAGATPQAADVGV